MHLENEVKRDRNFSSVFNLSPKMLTATLTNAIGLLDLKNLRLPKVFCGFQLASAITVKNLDDCPGVA